MRLLLSGRLKLSLPREKPIQFRGALLALAVKCTKTAQKEAHGRGDALIRKRDVPGSIHTSGFFSVSRVRPKLLV